MTEEQSDTPNISLAWERYITNNVLDEQLRLVIAQSWYRCREAEVDPYLEKYRLVLNELELNELMEKKRNLIETSKIFYGKIYDFVVGLGYFLLLTDEMGYVLDIIGDDDVIAAAADINLVKGSCQAENQVGTNGIGTALAINAPIQVSGAEHYLKTLHSWTCSAAPIYDHKNKLIGALQLSGPCSKSSQHTLGIVIGAVEAIRNQLIILERNRELILLNNQLNNIFLSVTDGIIVTDNVGLIIKINPVTETIFSINDQAMEDQSIMDCFEKSTIIQEMLTSGSVYQGHELIAKTQNGSIRCLSSGKVIRDKFGNVTGSVVFLKPINKVKNIVNHYSGSHATFHFKDIIGQDQQLLKAIELARIAAKNESNVLLQGDSGTGKEVFAHAIHNLSCRQDGPFLAINCGAIPRELIGSELFGYEGGAFTGAKAGGRPGKFELATGGTLLLDEIGEMPLEHQVSLLRVLQDKNITRIGGNKTMMVDVRIICASNKNLQLEVARGNFRNDLFFRLNVINISLPPLRERREDIPLLVNVFLKDICKKMGFALPSIDPEVLPYLKQYDWPGNIRELQNVIERMIDYANGENIGLKHLPEEIIAPDYHTSLVERIPFSDLHTQKDEEIKIKELVSSRERQQLVNMLIFHKSNISKVAKEMGVSRNTVYKKLKRLNISIK